MTDVQHTANPGSPEAVAKGCTCPVIDNHHGKGVPAGDLLHREFWVTEGCPLHGQAAATQAGETP